MMSLRTHGSPERVPGAWARAMATLFLKKTPGASRQLLAKTLVHDLRAVGIKYNLRTITRQLSGGVATIPPEVEGKLQELLAERHGLETRAQVDAALTACGLRVPRRATLPTHVLADRVVPFAALWLHLNPDKSTRWLARRLHEDLKQGRGHYTVQSLQLIFAGVTRGLVQQSLVRVLLALLAKHGIPSEKAARRRIEELRDAISTSMRRRSFVDGRRFRQLCRLWQLRNREPSARRLALLLQNKLGAHGVRIHHGYLQRLITRGSDEVRYAFVEVLEETLREETPNLENLEEQLAAAATEVHEDDLGWVSCTPIVSLAREWLTQHPSVTQRQLAIRVSDRLGEIGYSCGRNTVQTILGGWKNRTRGYVYRALREVCSAPIEMPRQRNEQATIQGTGTRRPAAAAPNGSLTGRAGRERGAESPLGHEVRNLALYPVMSREDEKDAALAIEHAEVDQWVTLLSYRPAAPRILDALEVDLRQANEAETAEAIALLRRLRRHRIVAGMDGEPRWVRRCAGLARRLRTLDRDRLWMGRAFAIARAPDDRPERHVRSPEHEQYVARVKKNDDVLVRLKRVFVLSNLRLVVFIARGYDRGQMPLSDLVQEGNIGLMKAVDRFDVKRGFRFSTYAGWWIREAIRHALANTGRTIRIPSNLLDSRRQLDRKMRVLTNEGQPPTIEELQTATGFGRAMIERLQEMPGPTTVSLDQPVYKDGFLGIDLLTDADAPSPFDNVVRSEESRELQRLLQVLSPREARLLRLRFGLEYGEELTLEEIGTRFRLTRERIRQIENRALEKMRDLANKSV